MAGRGIVDDTLKKLREKLEKFNKVSPPEKEKTIEEHPSAFKVRQTQGPGFYQGVVQDEKEKE